MVRGFVVAGARGLSRLYCQPMELLKDLWGFLRERKKWWLLPIILMLTLMAGLLVLTESAIIAPFIYALF